MIKIISVEFFKTEMENEPVREWLKSLLEEDRKKIGSDIKTVELGWVLGMPLVKKIDKNPKLWEVRTNLSSGKISRVIFTVDKDCMVLLHGFITKDQKIPLKDKNLATDRAKNFYIGKGCDEK